MPNFKYVQTALIILKCLKYILRNKLMLFYTTLSIHSLNIVPDRIT